MNGGCRSPLLVATWLLAGVAIVTPALARDGHDDRCAGARDVNRTLLWSAQSMGASRATILRRVVIPATAPFIFAGFRVAAPVAMIVVVITEMVASADGLGYQVIYAMSSLRTDRMLAVVVVIAALGYLLDKTVVLARDRLIYWEKLDTYYV